MKLHHLRALVALAETGSFNAASETLNITQGALSKAIKELESSLGIALFERSNKGARLTSQGQRLVMHARFINESVRRAKDDLLEAEDSGNITTTIGITPVVSIMKEIGDCIIEFRRRNPKIRLRVLEMRPSQLMQELRDGTLDFALSSQMPAYSRPDECVLLRHIPSLLACRKGHPLREARSIRDLLDQEWVVHDPRDDVTAPFHRLFTQERLRFPERVTECTATVTAHLLTVNTDSVTMLTSASFTHRAIAETLVPIQVREMLPARELVLVARNRHVFTAPVLQLYETVRKSLSDPTLLPSHHL
ncbi:LysR family transcriptional regulator [Nguyenibacter vanlangensis]|uniref:LysR family transcriptional regulator n=1 Tax=Nguyenibacter vanlangensis TaxID=1216886 RepID=A0ABZ3D0E3_9PROT